MTLEDSQLSSAAERGRRLRILRNMSDLTIHEFAEKFGIGASTIKYWESGKNEGLSSKGAKRVIEAMSQQGVHCTFMWLLHGVGNMPHFIDVHYGSKNSDGSLEEELAISNEINLFLKNTSNAVTLLVFDDAMDPLFNIGTSIGGNRLFGDDLNKAIGHNCIVETEEKQILCRKLAKGNELGFYNLCCTNPQSTVTPPNIYNVKITSAAPITRVWKRFVCVT